MYVLIGTIFGKKTIKQYFEIFCTLGVSSFKLAQQTKYFQNHSIEKSHITFLQITTLPEMDSEEKVYCYLQNMKKSGETNDHNVRIESFYNSPYRNKTEESSKTMKKMVTFQSVQSYSTSFITGTSQELSNNGGVSPFTSDAQGLSSVSIEDDISEYKPSPNKSNDQTTSSKSSNQEMTERCMKTEVIFNNKQVR